MNRNEQDIINLASSGNPNHGVTHVACVGPRFLRCTCAQARNHTRSTA